MLSVDRYLGGHFFDTQAGGSAVLWMHFFWIFGHPEVYILVIPAFAFASEIIPVFSRKPIFGYPVMVAATVCIGFISFSVWAHHMFTVGMSSYGNTFFTVTTMIIAVPTGIKIFNWIGTMWGGKIQFRPPMLFCTGFLFQFLIAGLTGIMMAAAPFDWQLGNSYFVVAHFHYVIVGAILFTIFGAVYYWFPKMSGRMYSEALAKWHFWSNWLPSDFRFHAYPRNVGNAAPDLHLRAGTRMGNLELDRHHRRGVSNPWSAGVCLQSGAVAGQRRSCRKRSLGRVDARVVYEFTAAGIQLRQDSRCQKPSPSLEHEASGRSGLEV